MASSSALCVRAAGAVDLIGQQQLREHRALPEFELLRGAVEDRHAEDVGRQQVAGELHALPGEAQHLRQRMGEGGLADAGHVLDQQVAARQQAGEGEPQRAGLAEDDAVEGGEGRGQWCRHAGSSVEWAVAAGPCTISTCRARPSFTFCSGSS